MLSNLPQTEMVILPSGFITPKNQSFMKAEVKEDPNPLYKQLANTTNAAYLSADNIMYSRELVVSTHGLIDNPKKAEPEKILKFLFNVMDAVGIGNFTSWVHLQAKSTYLPPTAKVYILETLEFVLNNTPRLHAARIYRTLIRALANNSVDGVDKTFKAAVDKYPSITVEEFLSLWLARDNGLTDMIDFVYIVFVDKAVFNSFKGTR